MTTIAEIRASNCTKRVWLSTLNYLLNMQKEIREVNSITDGDTFRRESNKLLTRYPELKDAIPNKK